MKIPRRTGAPRRSPRWAALVGAAALVTSLAACSSGPAGVVVNLYGGASATSFDKIIADCNAKAAGRYTIVGNLLPSDADGQRDQLVRRLAAKDAGMDLLGHGRHVDSRVRRGRLDPRAQPASRPPPPRRTPSSRRSTRPPGRTSSTASRSTRTSSCSGTARSRPDPAEDVRRDDGDGPAAQGPGQALRDRVHRRPVRGLRGEHQQPDHRVRRHKSSTTTAPRPRSTTRPCRRSRCSTSSPRPA